MADNNKGRETAAVLLSGTAAIASIANLLKKIPVAQAGTPGEFPPEVLEYLQAITTGMAATIEEIQAILQAIESIVIGGGTGYPPNADYPISGTFDLLVPLTTYRLPDITIPDDFEITIKAYPTNPPGSLIYVAKSAGESIDRYASYPLMPNESRGYRIKNAKELYVSATVAPGCSVTWTVEQRR
ncbi:MAG: hypothetical protein PHU23_00155 [Dehalococcoidales bacterium]|nr:hypothetical protein [Dehalococcoidales bacterium]